MKTDFDIIVVGGGGAGLTAAAFAHRAGASVMILEADGKLGGATRLSRGVIYAAGTAVQRSLGIIDEPQAMYDYIMTLNGWDMRPDMVRLFAERSAASLEWLVSLGADYEWVVKSGVDTVPRGHCTVGGGDTIGRLLINEVGAQGIEVALQTRVERLLVEAGRVVGVHASGMDLRAHAVIITTGGFGNNPAMRAQYYPSAARHGEAVYAVHHDAPFILGDGIKLCEMVGARIVGHDTGLALPSANLAKNSVESMLPPWCILVNDEGRRFMPETSPYAVSGYLIDAQPGAHAWAIFDEPILAAESGDKRFSDLYHTGELSQTWDEDLIRHHVKSGKVRFAPSLEALADLAGVNRLTLAQTVARYNDDARKGVDLEWNKRAAVYRPITGPGFFAVEVRASVVGQTSTGLDIDAQARVRDRHGAVIPGLFAAGEVLGCVQGKRYAGGGIGIASALTFGRLAGEEAAKAARSA